MNYWTTQEAAAAWGITGPSVRKLIRRGRVPTARLVVDNSVAAWHIPANTPKPEKLKTGPKPK